MTIRRSIAALLLTSSLLAAPAFADPTLEDGFKNPPQSARPRVWWHWMNGNITEEGVKLDMEWMKRVGIGGMQNFDAQLMTPTVVKNRLVYMTPDWKHAFKFAATTADNLGLELAIAASPGWSESGGPWVKPEDGMKKLVWSETLVGGGKPFGGKLAEPPHTTGPFMDAGMPMGFGAPSGNKYEYYRDTNVIAYRSSAATLPAPRISSSVAGADLTTLTDGKLTTGITLKGEKGSAPWLRFDYDTPQTIQSASIAMPARASFFGPGPLPTLEASSDGVTFVKVEDFDASGAAMRTISFAPITVKALRIVFTPTKGGGIGDMMGSGAPGAAFPGFDGVLPPMDTGAKVNEVSFSAAPRVHHAEDKAAFAISPDYYALAGPAAAGVTLADVIDLTAKMKPDGSLDWTPPAGSWRVLRFGATLTGTENHPAPKEATGLEVDKYDADAVRRYINTYLDTYVDAAGAGLMGKHGVRALLNDSTEVDPSNWSRVLPVEFKARRGYELTPWLPALTGVVIGDSAKTDAFLYDFRKTLAELEAEAHYKTIAEEAHKRGLIHYSEALEDGRPILGDDMRMRSFADVPMSAFWTYDKATGPRPTYYADIRGAASVAHIYGQNLVAAESLTASLHPWAFSPRDLQPMIDEEFALGVNRPVIHTSVHQPLTDHAPGFSLFIFGQYFNRLETWAEQAKPWVDYISRNSYMLQQGRFVADVAYFYGEEAPLTAQYAKGVPTDTPTKNGFDYVNPDVLLNQLSNDGGEVVAKSGARYKVIYLGGSSRMMSLQVLRRLNDLVQAGATVVGEKPAGSPTLQDDPTAFSALADGLWSGKTGKGKVLASHDINAALTTLGVAPDFDFKAENADAKLMFVHRKTPTAEIYYFTNRKDRAEKVDLSFNEENGFPVLWDAATGVANKLATGFKANRVVVPMTLRPYQSGYVVYTKQAPHGVTDAVKNVGGQLNSQITPLTTLSDHWSLSFQPNRGAPTGILPATLGDLATNANPQIKYFSGIANYTRSLDVKPVWLKPGQHLMLDLGEVRELAEVIINGKSAGIAWKAPYAVDVTKFIHPGANKLEVKVTNLWVNRLIGDAQPGAKPITFTTLKSYRADAPLRPSGLMGPVTLKSER